MNTSSFKGLLLCGIVAVIINSAILLAQQNISVTTNLSGPVQHIGTIIFAKPQSTGGWESTGQVPVSAENEKVTINGSLLTNGNQKNAIKSSAPQYVSILGGKGNTMFATGESLLLGGSGNSTTAFQSFIGGGEGNAITGNSQRSAILGGKQNNLVGENTVILGGEGNRISGNNSVTLGNNVIITGNASLGAGSGVRLSGSGSFVWNGNGATFTVSQGNLFAVNAKRGMVVNTNEPHLIAILTVEGDIRVDTGTTAPACNQHTAGTVKTVLQADGMATCSCACASDGKPSPSWKWYSVVNTQECKSKCS